MLASFAKAGIDIDALAARLQSEGAAAFVKSWNDLMGCIESKRAATRNRWVISAGSSSLLGRICLSDSR
jgi:hypothetical protein